MLLAILICLTVEVGVYAQNGVPLTFVPTETITFTQVCMQSLGCPTAHAVLKFSG